MTAHRTTTAEVAQSRTHVAKVCEVLRLAFGPRSRRAASGGRSEAAHELCELALDLADVDVGAPDGRVHRAAALAALNAAS